MLLCLVEKNLGQQPLLSLPACTLAPPTSLKCIFLAEQDTQHQQTATQTLLDLFELHYFQRSTLDACCKARKNVLQTLKSKNKKC